MTNRKVKGMLTLKNRTVPRKRRCTREEGHIDAPEFTHICRYKCWRTFEVMGKERSMFDTEMNTGVM